MANQWSKKRETIKHYDQLAEAYDRQYKEEQDAKIAVALKNLNKMDTSLTLDMGCGTGLLFKHIANQATFLIGMDTSRELLKQAKNKAKTHDNIMLVQADADHTPFRAKTFTEVFALTLLQNMPEPKNTLKEIKRIAQHNGSIIVTGLKKQFQLETFTRLLKDAQLEIVTITEDEKLKDYIAICRKH